MQLESRDRESMRAAETLKARVTLLEGSLRLLQCKWTLTCLNGPIRCGRQSFTSIKFLLRDYAYLCASLKLMPCIADAGRRIQPVAKMRLRALQRMIVILQRLSDP